MFPGDCDGVFNRAADLNRHYRNVHAPNEYKDKFLCDYIRCDRSKRAHNRKDHLRDHYKEYHKEDIEQNGGVVRHQVQTSGSWVPSVPMNTWWRCQNCFERVSIEENKCHCQAYDTLCYDWERTKDFCGRHLEPGHRKMRGGSVVKFLLESQNVLAASNLFCALLMGSSFMWLQHNMSLGISSQIMREAGDPGCYHIGCDYC